MPTKATLVTHILRLGIDAGCRPNWRKWKATTAHCRFAWNVGGNISVGSVQIGLIWGVAGLSHEKELSGLELVF